MFASQTARAKASRDCILGSTNHNSSPGKNIEAYTTQEFVSLITPIAAAAAVEQQRPVRIQLCLCLAALLLRSEGDPATNVSQALSHLQSGPALLDFVANLPDEWSRESVKVTPDRRNMGLLALRETTANALLPLLHQEYENAATDQARESILICFHSWLSADCVHPEILAKTTILESAAHALGHPPLVAAACDLLQASVGIAGRPAIQTVNPNPSPQP